MTATKTTAYASKFPERLPRFDPAGMPCAWKPGRKAKDDTFFPPDGERGPRLRGRINRAKGICAGCHLRTACLDEALANREEWGIWGGTTPEERRGILAAREPRRLPEWIERELTPA